jgi:hypothetical protein
MDTVRADLTLLVLTEDNMTLGYEHPSFDEDRKKVIDRLAYLKECKEYGLLRKEITELITLLNGVKLDYSRLSDMRTTYGSFSRKRDAFLITLNNFETRMLITALRDSIVRYDSAQTKHYSILLDTLTYHSPLYTGINWFTRSGLGFGVHYHIKHDLLFSPLAALTLLYQWGESEQDQGTAQDSFGVAFSGGVSVRLSQYNRLGFMGEVAMISGEVKPGIRLMAYNQHLAVGMGYNEYMGADITLLIRFHDPR